MLEEVQASFQLENWNTELDTLAIFYHWQIGLKPAKGTIKL